MDVAMFVGGVVSFAAGIWLVNKVRKREGVEQPRWMTNAMAQMMVFVIFALLILGIGLVAKAITG